MWHDLDAIDPKFVYEGERRRYVAFPLGGIGAGGFAITGSGRLMDWSIRNRPGLQKFNGYSHFAIKAERDGALVDARVLNGPYDLNPAGSPGMFRVFDGFGHGANRDSMVGLPHFRTLSFVGRFPVADLVYADQHFPGRVRQTAFSPFIPHNDRDSSMPVACFAFEVVNDTAEALDYTLAATFANFQDESGVHGFERRDGVSLLRLGSTATGPNAGELTIATDADETEHTDYHYRGHWFDSKSVYWREFARPGRLTERHYDEPRTGQRIRPQPEHGTLGARFRLAPGEHRVVRFVVSWSFPVAEIYWTEPPPPAPLTYTNYYATQWRDSRDSAAEMLSRWDELAGPTFAFRDAIFGSSLPVEIVDAATGTMAILRSPTVIRLSGGQIWAWEGVHTDDGSCDGSCTHVWNYQQAMAFLFPALERTLRETEFTYNQLPDGGLTFRQKLPLGSGFDAIGPCADGHWGAIIKTFRDWKLAGDTAWLSRLWPQVRRAIEYGWSPDNPDRWDPERTGVLWGRQHHTLDMELFGPNSWLSSMYVAALQAGAQMAEALGEQDFADECRRVAEAGAAYIDSELFNGEYYFQKTELGDRSVIDAFAHRRSGVLSAPPSETYWSAEHGQLKYQIANGCLTDQILGQWHADVAGLGGFLDAGKVKSALGAIYRHNFRSSLHEHVNPARVYGYEDEGGTLLCTWPLDGSQPMVPAPYSEEVWTGIEYQFASHLIMRGLVEEGLACVRAARARYDGARRNPWNEIECGSYYARSMSAYALVNAYAGLAVDATRKRLSFAPAANGDFDLFWSAGQGWGRLQRRGHSLALEVIGGQLPLAELHYANLPPLLLSEPGLLTAGETLHLAIAGTELQLRDEAL